MLAQPAWAQSLVEDENAEMQPESDAEGLDLEAELFFSPDEVVTSAARHEQKIGMSPSAISVITRADIEASGATTIPDLLRMIPGLDVVKVSPSWTGVTGRIYWFFRTLYHLVLIDGREATIDTLGEVLWQTEPIALGDIERIEVIRGPASSLYGSRAFSGVINIITRRIAKKDSASASIQAGESGVYTLTANGSARLGDLGISVSGQLERFGSFSDARTTNQNITKFRALAEYQISKDEQLVLEAAVSFGSALVFGTFGDMESKFSMGIVRLQYQAGDFKSNINWKYIPIEATLLAPFNFNGIRLANFVKLPVESHSFNAGLQWTVPQFWEPLTLIVGSEGRVAWIQSDQLLDAETFSDPRSRDYHQPGILFWDLRASVFVHSELSPTDWVTITAGARLDYNNQTNWFLSPKLAWVFHAGETQYLRVGASRAFRAPNFIDSGLHPMVDFPPESPIQGKDQDKFLEFMTRVIGNPWIQNEELTSIEAGYLGHFLDRKLDVSLDLYYNLLKNKIANGRDIVVDQGLPDLEKSSARMNNIKDEYAFIGSELSVRWEPLPNLSLMFSWSYRESCRLEGKDLADCGFDSPKNLFTLGGRFQTGEGLVGSLYAFSRSEFWDREVASPNGMLDPFVVQHLDNVLLVMGRLGFRHAAFANLTFETGVKWFLPLSPFSGRLWGYYEKGGGFSTQGERYGSEKIERMIILYLEGSI